MGITEADFYWPDELPVTEATVSKQSK